jgi:outer membrane immunogenic protein
MHRLLVALFAVAAGLGPGAAAYAADLPVKAAPAAVVTQAWTGWYVGLSGGYGWGHSRQRDDSPYDSQPYRIEGGLVGGTLGANRQFGSIVVGAETDLSYSWITGSTIGFDPVFDVCGGIIPRCETTIRALGTLRGRVGVAAGALLGYLTGGLAYANLHGKEGDGPAGGAFGSGSEWVTGWTAGAGVEGIIAPNWSAKIEYLYVDLGTHDVFISNVFGAPFPQRLTVTTHIVRAGINYRFAGPLVP